MTTVAPITDGTCNTEAPPTGTSRTVIFVQKATSVGQDLFVRGGIDHAKRPGCVENAASSACAISMAVNLEK